MIRFVFRGVLMNNNKEGIDRVQKENGDYAFMMESTIVEYVVERRCKLAQVAMHSWWSLPLLSM